MKYGVVDMPWICSSMQEVEFFLFQNTFLISSIMCLFTVIHKMIVYCLLELNNECQNE